MADLQGKVVYSLVLTDQGVVASMNSFKTGMQGVDSSVTATSKNMGALNSNFANFNKTVQSGTAPLTNLRSQMGALPATTNSATTSMSQFGASTEKTNSKLQSFGEKFKSNRGMVFGIAGLSSALAEAVGMMDMMAMSSEQLTEAQDKLNDLTEQGITSGKEYEDALADVNKAEKFANMTRRNTMLSMMDMVFFSTMVIGGLTKMGAEGGKTGGILSKLTGIFKKTSGTTSQYSTTIKDLGLAAGQSPVQFNAMAKGAQGSTSSLQTMTGAANASRMSVLALGGALAAIGIGAFAIITIIQNMESLKAKLTEVFGEAIMQINTFQAGILQLKATLKTATAEELKSLETINAARELETRAVEELGISAIAYALNWDNAHEKVKKKIQELIKEDEKLNETFSQVPVDAHIDFNAELDNQRTILKTVIPDFKRYIQDWRNSGQSIEVGREAIDDTVDASTKLNDVQKEMLKAKLKEFFDEYEKALKGTADQLETVTDLGVEAGKELQHFGESLTLGIKGTETVIPRVTGYIARWRKEQADAIPTLKTLGTDTENLQFWVAQYGGTLIDIVVAGKLYNDQEKDNLKTTREATKVEDERAKKLKESQDALRGHTTAITNNVEINERIKKAMDDTTGSVIEQAKQLRDSRRFWEGITEAEIKNTKEALQSRMAYAQLNDVFALTNENAFLVAKAEVEGAEAAKEFTQETFLARVENDSFRTTLLALNDVLLKEMDTFNMLDSEIQDYIEFAMGGRDATIELARASEEARDSMVESFSGLFDTEKFKDFKNEFKELDLKEVFGKEGAGDFRDMFKDMRDSAKDVEVLQTAMNALGVAVQDVDEGVHRMSGKDLAQNFDKFAEAYKETIIEAGLGNDIVDDMILKWEELSGTELRQKLNEIPQTWMMINEAIKTNGISNQEALAIDIMRKKETGEITKLTEDQIKVIEEAGFVFNETTGEITKLSEEQQKIADNNTLARTINQVKINYNLQARAVRGLSNDTSNLRDSDSDLIKTMNTLARATNQNFKNFNQLGRAIRGVSADAIQLKKNLDNIPRNIKINITASGSGLRYAQSGMHETLAHDQLIYAHKGERVDIGSGSKAQTASHTSHLGTGGGVTNEKQHTTIILKIGMKSIKQELDYMIGETVQQYIP